MTMGAEPDGYASTDEALRFVERADFVWHQRFELAPGVYAPGANDIEWLLGVAGLPPDLDGLSVLDVGTTNGGAAFEAERRRARRVVAIDIFGPHWFGFSELKDLLGSEVEYRRASAYELAGVLDEQFDVVLFFGVLYHLRHPLLALDNLRAVTGDRCHLETAVADHESGEFAKCWSRASTAPMSSAATAATGSSRPSRPFKIGTRRRGSTRSGSPHGRRRAPAAAC